MKKISIIMALSVSLGRSAVVKLVSPNNVPYAYNAIADHGLPGQPDGQVVLYFTDFPNSVAYGQVWSVTPTSLTPELHDFTRARYGYLVDAEERYRKAAWLAARFPTHLSDGTDIQRTIWQLFVPTAPAPDSSYWRIQADLHFGELKTREMFWVLTPSGAGSASTQLPEVLLFESSSPAMVPESSGLLLVPLGLIGILATKLLRFSVHSKEA